MYFKELAGYLERLEGTSSRNTMTDILADLLKHAGGTEIDEICYLILGELVPAYRGLEFQIAEKMMIAALAAAYSTTREEAARRVAARGDVGDAAYDLARDHRSLGKRMTVAAVYRAMYGIAEDAGEESQERKIRAMASLLSSLDPLSAKYVARIPLGKLRLGFSDATLLDALSLMVTGDKSGRRAIERAYNVTADIGALASRVKRGGLASLSRLHATPGIPIRPSLAERLNDINDVVKKAGPIVGVEVKLDGFRTQIHVWREKGGVHVRLFSRNLENTTAMFPEIVHAAKKLPVQSVILDTEAIGYYARTDTFAPFQETVQRKRKHEVAEFAARIPLAAFVFDVMYRDGTSLVARPFRERRRHLQDLLGRRTGAGTIRLAGQRLTDDIDVIKAELTQSVNKGLEGLVVKNLSAPYEAGSRGFHWIKLKANTAALGNLRAGGAGGRIKGLPDTIDCLVMGAYRGRGKRTKFGVGGFLLGVPGRDERFYSLSRLGTGMSDEQFRELGRRIKAHEVAAMPKEYVVDKEVAPDIWIEPSLVVEILADEITRSPRHSAGRGRDRRGLSLRFPRLVRVRDDKKPHDATSADEVSSMHRRQKTASSK